MQIAAKTMSIALPSVKGGIILAASYTLNFLSDSTRSISLWGLTVVLTCLGIYDFVLKIRYKHRKERENKEDNKE